MRVHLTARGALDLVQALLISPRTGIFGPWYLPRHDMMQNQPQRHLVRKEFQRVQRRKPPPLPKLPRRLAKPGRSAEERRLSKPEELDPGDGPGTGIRGREQRRSRTVALSAEQLEDLLEVDGE